MDQTNKNQDQGEPMEKDNNGNQPNMESLLRESD